MNNLIYYPGFEVKDKSWLKFALLFIDHIHPIIPKSGLSFLSDEMNHIIKETDLIIPYCPNYDEGQAATCEALNQFDLYLKNPERYVPHNRLSINNKNKVIVFRAKNLIDKWKNKDNQNYTLFGEKYSWLFENYCIENQLAHGSKVGLQISEELAYVYMSFLADEIANRNGFDTITDNYLSNDLLLRKAKKDPQNNILNIMNNRIRFEIPKNLNDVEMKKIIKLRNNDNFNLLRKKYMEQVIKHLHINNNEKSLYNNDFLECSSEIKSIIYETFKIGMSAAIISFFGIELLTAATVSIVPTAINMVQEALDINDNSNGIISSVKKISDKQIAKKYLAKLRKL